MNKKRVIISTIIGVLCGIFCSGSIAMNPNPGFPVTLGLLIGSLFYNRVLIGFVVGIADQINLHPVPRGGLIGAIITLTISLVPIIDGRPAGGLILLVFGVIYGIIADVIATRFSK